MDDVNLAFCRALLAQVIPDVREHVPDVKLREAWVYHTSLGDWEFHYGDFYWYGSADNAYDARYKGWSAYLKKLGVEGYVDDPEE